MTHLINKTALVTLSEVSLGEKSIKAVKSVYMRLFREVQWPVNVLRY